MASQEKKDGSMEILDDKFEEMAEELYLTIYRVLHQDSSKTTGVRSKGA